MRLRMNALRADAGLVFADPFMRDHGWNYLQEIGENRRRTNEARSKDIILILSLVGVFELLTRAAITKASLGPFEISDLSLIRISIPVVVAYLYYDISVLERFQDTYNQIFENVMRALSNVAVEQGFEDILKPPPGSLAYPSLLSSHPARLVRVMNSILAGITAGGVVLFEIYAFSIQLLKFDSQRLFTLMTIIPVLALILAAMFIFLSNITE